MKKRVIIISATVFAVLLAVAFIILSPYFISKPIVQVLNVDFSKVDKIVIAGGLKGKGCTLVDKISVDDIIKRLDGVRLRKSFDQRRYDAETLSVTLYESGKEVSGFVYSGNIITMGDFSHLVRYETSIELADGDIAEILNKYHLED